MKLRIIFALIIAVVFTNPSIAQKQVKRIVISGIVTDTTQKPIAGANVLIDNKNTNRITNKKGFYKVKVRSDAKLIKILSLTNAFTETPIDGRTTINFSINNSGPSHKHGQTNIENDESVNVGYGTMNKKDLITPVGRIDPQNPKYSSYMNIYDMLEGQPGVQVVGTSVTIQGASSISLSTEPLFVVDGIPVSSIDNISPRMVKSIEILKGASGSIYGSKGANGVILINLYKLEDKK